MAITVISANDEDNLLCSFDATRHNYSDTC